MFSTTRTSVKQKEVSTYHLTIVLWGDICVRRVKCGTIVF